jgi:23S rRNA pseudouridine1911/1915/1917 synthase
MSLFPKDRNLSESPERLEIPVHASDFQIRAEDVSLRLDAFLAHHLRWRSRTSIQRLIRSGQVFVDSGAPERAGSAEETVVEKRCGRLLRHGMRVEVVIPEECRLPPVAADRGDLHILYEDEELLCVDKPPGLAVHPSGRHVTNTLIQRVHACYASGEPGERLPIRLCHRLDRETSGLVLLGKKERAHREIMRQFEAHEIEKEYLAIVRGSPRGEGGTIDHPLSPALVGRVRLKMTTGPDGLPSETRWSVVERREGFTLISCRPRTGRQHQIRVHLDAIGHPIVGDKLYGLDEEYFLRAAAGELEARDLVALGMPRHALHNHRIAWHSPRTGARLEVESPLPADMRDFLDRAPSPRGSD